MIDPEPLQLGKESKWLASPLNLIELRSSSRLAIPLPSPVGLFLPAPLSIR